jgi:hypothetical protein
MGAYWSTGAVRNHLGQRWLRLHSSLIGLVVVAAGFGLAKLLLAVGIDQLAMRYALVVLGAYGVMLVCVRLWIAYVYWRDHRDAAADAADAADYSLDAADILTGVRGSPVRGAGFDAGSADWAAFGIDDLGVGVGLLVLAALVLAVAGAGAYLLLLAPEVLVDAAIAWVIAAGMVRNTDGHGSGGWLRAVIRKTWPVLGLCLLLGVGLGAYIEAVHPDAQTLKQAISLMLRAT